MNSESVHLIATDPPFNKGRDFHATPDSLAAGAKFQDRWSWERDVHQEWIDQLTDDHPKLIEAIESARYAHSDGMGAYMCFMAVRLLEMRRVLRSDGSIYLHCDPTASHYLKAIMDAIFGWRNFRNEVLWLYKTGGMSKRWFGRKHDNLLFYSKGKDYTFNPQKEKSYLSHKYGFSNVEILEDEHGVYTMVGMRDYWDIPALRGNQPETVGFPTQKPLALYERIIKASSNEGDMVLDPFAGCATTCVVAEQHRRQWAGIDIWDKAHKTVVDRLKSTTGLFGEVHYQTDLPERTDDGLPAVPSMKTVHKVQLVGEPPDRFKTRQQKLDYLLSVHGCKCAGCDREFDDPRYLELDHNAPRSTGGLNHTSNRILLCGPCNRLKSNVYTLIGLRRKNKQLGYMAGTENPKLKEIREAKRRNPGLFD